MRGFYDLNFGTMRMFYSGRQNYRNYNEIKNMGFRCDVVKDKDILDALKDVKLKSDYIKKLIRRGLEAERAEKESALAQTAENVSEEGELTETYSVNDNEPTKAKN